MKMKMKNKKDRCKMIIKNKKGGMSVSIALLVLATLVLSCFSLLTFYLREKNLREIIYLSSLEDIYSKEAIVNFYIYEAMESAIKKSKNPDFSKADFITNFMAEINAYNLEKGAIVMELEQLKQQINEESIKYNAESKIVSAEFQIIIEDKIVVMEDEKEKELFSASYTYKKKFEKAV